MTTIEDSLTEIFSKVQKFIDNLPEGITKEELITLLAKEAEENAINMELERSQYQEICFNMATMMKEEQEDEEFFRGLHALRRFDKDLL